MNITFTTAELHEIMRESYSFREKMISLLEKDILAEYRAIIRKKFPLFASSEKIPAIKWIREELRGKKDELKEFSALNYEVYGNRSAWENDATLGLAAAKKFVESC